MTFVVPPTHPLSGADFLPRQVAAILFDMDDTLVDSEYAWRHAANRLWYQAGARHEAPIIAGGTLDDLAQAFCREFPTHRPSDVVPRLGQYLDECLGQDVRPMPGAADLLAHLDPAIPLAVASNSPTSVVRRTVESLGWSQRLCTYLGTEDVTHPKPAPDLYREAAQRCGALPEQCVIFEDSPMGAQAALASGAFVVTLGNNDLGHRSLPSLTDSRIRHWQPQLIDHDRASGLPTLNPHTLNSQQQP